MSQNKIPFFTIITATYNAAATLPRLLTSLAEQTCQDFTWVCQDAQSKDATVGIVEQWREKLPSISLTSEKDSGIYDAWNKALARQGEQLGEWVLFLGADDLLADPRVLEKIKEHCQQSSSETVLVEGSLQQFALDGSIVKTVSIQREQSFAALPFCMIAHPSLFGHKSLFLQHTFDTSFRIAGDWDWLHKVWLREKQLSVVDVLVTKMSVGGISTNNENVALFQQETRKILHKHKHKYPNLKYKIFLRTLDSFFTPSKSAIKSSLQKSSLGNSVWKWLQRNKKNFFK